MAAESPQHHPTRQPDQAHEAREEERFGPLGLLRTSKADGRALLLFSRRDEEGESKPR